MNARACLWIGLATLVAANLVVAAAWWRRDALVAAGWLAEGPPTRLDLPRLPLPPLDAIEPDGAPVPPAPERPQTTVRDACVAYGPFETRDEAAALAERIETTGGTAELLERSLLGEPDYRVYVEPAASRTLAHRTWRELVASGIDAYVISRGERENGVSVGVFTRRELAVAQRERVAELGFPVAMRTVRRSRTAYLLHARGASAGAIAGLPTAPCEPVVAGEKADS